MSEDCLPCKISLCVLLNVLLLGPQGPLLLKFFFPYPAPCLCPGFTALIVRKMLWFVCVCVSVCVCVCVLAVDC